MISGVLIFLLFVLYVTMKEKHRRKNQQKNLDTILSSIISNNENPSDIDL